MSGGSGGLRKQVSKGDNWRYLQIALTLRVVSGKGFPRKFGFPLLEFGQANHMASYNFRFRFVGKWRMSPHSTTTYIWGFPKMMGTILGFSIIRTRVFWGLYWGPPILGNYHTSSFMIPNKNSDIPFLHSLLTKGKARPRLWKLSLPGKSRKLIQIIIQIHIYTCIYMIYIYTSRAPGPNPPKNPRNLNPKLKVLKLNAKTFHP